MSNASSSIHQNVEEFVYALLKIDERFTFENGCMLIIY